MSLINEALKKAQNQRSGPASPVPPGGPPPPAAFNSPPAGAAPGGKTLLLVAAAAVIVSVSVVTTVFLLRDRSSPAKTISTVAAPTSFSPTNGGVSTVASATAPAPALPRIGPALSPAQAPSPNAGALTTSAALGSGNPASAAPVANIAPVAPVIPAIAPEPTPVKITVRIQALVDKFRVSGIRLSGTESKVILNDHLFRLDDPVESSLGLKITKIEAHRLTFVDADGNIYLKRL